MSGPWIGHDFDTFDDCEPGALPALREHCIDLRFAARNYQFHGSFAPIAYITRKPCLQGVPFHPVAEADTLHPARDDQFDCFLRHNSRLLDERRVTIALRFCSRPRLAS